MVNRVLVEHKLALLQDKKRELQSYKIASFADFKSKDYMQKAVEKVLQEMVEVCLDVAKHIIADEKLRVPEDVRDSVRILAESNVITESTSEKLAKMVGFRNLIVHLYEKIDLAIVYGVYSKHLTDFDQFSKEVLNYLAK